MCTTLLSILPRASQDNLQKQEYNEACNTLHLLLFDILELMACRTVHGEPSLF